MLLGLPLVLGPIQIALLEMIIDPVCALVFEAERDESRIMQRPPRDPAERLFSKGLILPSIVYGGIAFALLLGLQLGVTYWGFSPDRQDDPFLRGGRIHHGAHTGEPILQHLAHPRPMAKQCVIAVHRGCCAAGIRVDRPAGAVTTDFRFLPPQASGFPFFLITPPTIVLFLCEIVKQRRGRRA